MTTSEIKKEITKALDQVPETVLADILKYLNEAKATKPDANDFAANFKKILEQDNELLHKLAQ